MVCSGVCVADAIRRVVDWLCGPAIAFCAVMGGGGQAGGKERGKDFDDGQVRRSQYVRCVNLSW